MKTVIKSIIKYPTRSAIYVTLLIISFTTIITLVNSFIASLMLIDFTEELAINLPDNNMSIIRIELFIVRDTIRASSTSLIPLAALLILLCIFILPFLQYLLSVNRGYETGILRALGMSRSSAFIRLLTENIALLFMSLVVTQITALITQRRFTISLLSLDSAIIGVFSELNTDMTEVLSYNWISSLVVLGLVSIISIITAGLMNIIISNNSPLKLLRDYK